VTGERELYDKLRKIRNHGMLHGYDTRILGLNLRLPEMSAALAKVQMRRLPDLLRRRERNARMLTELLDGLGVVLPRERPGVRVNWYLYTVSAKNRDRLARRLNARGIGLPPTIPCLCTRRRLQFQGKAANDGMGSSAVLSLPVHPLVTEDQLHYIARVMRQELKR